MPEIPPPPEAIAAAEGEKMIDVRAEDGGPVSVDRTLLGTERDVRLSFKEAPPAGTLLKLEKPGAFSRIYSVEEPYRGVEKKPDTAYVRILTRDEIETRPQEPVGMRNYLTRETLNQLGI